MSLKKKSMYMSKDGNNQFGGVSEKQRVFTLVETSTDTKDNTQNDQLLRHFSKNGGNQRPGSLNHSSQTLVVDPKEKRNILIASMFSLMMIQTLFLNVENILPTWIPENVTGLKALQISFILSAFELSQLLFSPLIGKYLDKVGRKNMILIGDVIMIASTLAMGATQWLASNTDAYLWVCLVLRFIQGIGAAQVQTSCYAIITFVFSENREKYIGMAEAVSGIGLMLGPVIGGAIYTLTDYFWTFFFFAAVLFLSALFTFYAAPNALNKSLENTEEEGLDPSKVKKVTFSIFIFNKRCAFAFISCSVICLFMTYSSSFLTDVLKNDKDIPEAYNGLILALPCLTYAISSTLVSMIMGKFPRRLFILLAFVLLAISTVLQGPSEMLKLPDTNNLVLSGLALSGIAQGFIFIPLLPDAIEAVYIKENTIEGHNEYYDQLLNDMAAGLYGTFFSTGQILAPIVGGALYDAVGFRQTTDFMTIACLGYCLIFFIFNVGFRIFKEEKKIREKQEALEQLLQNRNNSILKEDQDNDSEIEDYIKKQRMKWSKQSENPTANNNLTIIKESQQETFLDNTFLNSKGSHLNPNHINATLITSTTHLNQDLLGTSTLNKSQITLDEEKGSSQNNTNIKYEQYNNHESGNSGSSNPTPRDPSFQNKKPYQ
eukprot:403337480